MHIKTFVLSLACSLFIYAAHAQISKGSIVLGGSFSFAYANDDGDPNDYHANSIGLRPSLGFVVKENQAVGFNLLFVHSQWKNGATQTDKRNEYGVGAFYRRYHPLGKSFYLYGQGEVNVSRMTEDYAYYNEHRTQTSLELNLLPGIAYALTKRFHLELSLNNMVSLGYGWLRADSSAGSPTPSKSNSIYFRIDPNPVSDLSLGFRILLGK